ncbi:MAG: class I SAM-dependent methyltransferase [Halanaerobiales bacterium]|nr:class I SAM-dependent methyltransferase [Halanaerobiales bacterium]
MGSQAYTSSFASIYDDIMKRVPYYYWYKYLKHLLVYYEKDPKNILELACGTGNMLKYFVDKSDLLYGVDSSEDMLAITKNKLSSYEHLKLYNTNMQDIFNYGDFDFIYSVFDSVNYIHSYEKLLDVFKNAYLNLKQDGIFIFDINTIYRLSEIKEGTRKVNGDDYTCFWKDIVKSESREWIVELEIYFENKEEDNNFSERHVEKGYQLRDIEAGLFEVGFKHVDFYKSFTFKKGRAKNNRVHFVALKNEYVNRYLKRELIKLKWNLLRLFISNI